MILNLGEYWKLEMDQKINGPYILVVETEESTIKFSSI